MSVKYSILASFTREWMIKRWFKSFLKMKLPKKDTELIICIDSNKKDIIRKILPFKEKLRDFKDVIMCQTNLPPLQDNEWYKDRRDRIISMREFTKEAIHGEYLIGIEDDTLCPDDTFELLQQSMKKNVAFVEGAEVGRWGYRNIGAFKIRCEMDKITEIRSLPVNKEEEEIDAGGLYCFMTLAKLYKQHSFFQEGEMGPDMNYVWSLRKMGLKCLINWNIHCIHCKPEEPLLVSSAQVIKWTPENDWMLL